MIEHINSDFFQKIMFSYIEKGTKLKIIKYNKNLQIKIGINILHYKVYSGRFIIYEAKGKGKEYNGYKDQLVYEGEFLNGERNGQGKEYDENVRLIYEGEFKNGKRNGKGKEYNYRGELIYEGEFQKGKRNGKGKSFINGKLRMDGEFLDDAFILGIISDEMGYISDEYTDRNGYKTIKDDFGFQIFEGEFLNGRKNGKGKEYYSLSHNLLFEGKYLNGQRNGKGKEYNYRENKTIIFEGEYLNGKRNGNAKIYFKNGYVHIQGEYLFNKPWNVKYYDKDGSLMGEVKNGKGKIRDFSIDNPDIVVEREYLYGEANGIGKIFFKNNLILEGEFLNGKLNGKGKEYNLIGEMIFEGEYIDNHKIKGKEYLDGKLIYDGEYLFDRKFNGKGYDKDGKLIYELINGNGTVIEEIDDIIFEGEYLNGRKHGKGKYYKNDYLFYDGEFKNGEANGKGKVFNESGQLMYEGDIKNTIPYGKGKKFYPNGQLMYEGDIVYGKFHGKGKYYMYNGILCFDAEFFEGKIHGKTKLYVEDKIRFEGEYLNGLQSMGKEYNEKGELIFEGEYSDGKRWNGKGKEYEDGKLVFEGIYDKGKKVEEK